MALPSSSHCVSPSNTLHHRNPSFSLRRTSRCINGGTERLSPQQLGRLSLQGRLQVLASTLSIDRKNGVHERLSALAQCTKSSDSRSVVKILPFLNNDRRPRLEDQSCSEFRPDEWLDDCIVEVIKNIQEAPFLQLVFDSTGIRRTERQRLACDLECEQAGADASWCNIKDRLAKAAPTGVILVQKLPSHFLVNSCCMNDSEKTPLIRHLDSENKRPSGITDVWGLLFLAERSANSACYILETTRVTSCAGVCTRFCLTRAQCFGPSVGEQLERMWLVNT